MVFVIVELLSLSTAAICFLVLSAMLNIFAAISFWKIEKACKRMERLFKIFVITSEDRD